MPIPSGIKRFALQSSFALLVPSAFSVTASAQVAAHQVARITQTIDAKSTVRLPYTHPAVADHATVGARVSASLPAKHMLLVLAASDEQELALQTLLSQQQDKNSANYHKWLTPETYAQSFGVASSDVAKITAWLQDQGFSVDSVAKSSRVITFSGTAGQVEAAFATEIHQVTVDGEAHITNTTDIAIPQAFASVVRGIASLNDFQPKSNAVGARNVQFSTPYATAYANNGISSPLYTSTSSGAHYVTPGDAAIIFNSTPLLTTGIDGTGQKIAVLGRTDINLSDVQQFRSMFGLKANDPTFTLIGQDPGTTSDDGEADLDVEWAGGMAPGANVNYVYAGSNYFTQSGIGDAGLYVVDNNLADIISLSYGGCETNNGQSNTAFWNTLWQQAAAQGQTVFVSTGDSAATGCSSSTRTTTSYGTAYGVNALGSSAYNVAVGGTMFVDYGPNQYWGTGSAAPVPAGYTFTTATSYIPEAAWNEGTLTTDELNTLSTATVTGGGIVGGGGGISIFTARPAWQVGSGISTTADPTNCALKVNGTCMAAAASGSLTTGLHRLVPDISGIAASSHEAAVFCSENSCYSTSNGYGIGAVGGTSVATPFQAGIQALINQKNGGRQGNANFYYYKLANQDYVAGNCKAVNGTAASPAVTLPASTCNFHDVVAGDNRTKSSSSDTTGLGFYSAAGFDEATGLGSMNVANVATNWSSVAFSATSTSFTLTPTTGAHGVSQAYSIAVSSSAGTPTGDVSIIASTTMPGTKLRYTLSGGAASGTLNSLPGGTYNVYAHYEGDGTYAASDSAPVQVTIAKEASTVPLTLADFYNGYVQTNVTSIPYGYLVDLYSTVASTSGYGIPSGTLTFAVSRNGAPLAPLTVTLDGTGTGSLIASAGYSSLLIAPNYSALSAGSYTVTATYSGDSTFNSSTGTISFVIAQQTPTITLALSPAAITSGGNVMLNATVSNPAGLTPTVSSNPSGTVTFTDTTTGTTLGTATMNSAGVASLTTTSITASGANSITATYSGDANYAAVTSLAKTVTVGTLTSTTTTAGSTANAYYVLSTVPLTATVTPSAATGTVSFYSDGAQVGSASLSGGVATLNTTALTAGIHTITTAYAGNTTYAGSTGTMSLAIAQNITSTTLNAPVSAVLGNAVALSARITRSPSQTSAGTVLLGGTVSFYDGSTLLGSSTPVYLPGGYYYYVATISTTSLTRGVHTLSAVYSGDANFAGSTSTGTVKTTILPGNIWVVNGSSSLSGINSTGGALATTSGGGTGIAIDGSGSIWSLNTSASSVAKFSNTGTVVSSGYNGAGLNLPAALAIDGGGNVWVANSNSTVSELSGAGVAVSGSSGFPAASSTPSSLNIDASGNVWITSSGDNSVTEVIGAAAPVITPTVKAVANNALAAKP
ncbi:Ig-like domain repeat protein [Granulicella cerasi]|uniref:Ig-like domain repeat protein n=1 Tax=Granulicella cerasi TaxID=741063 RepID=A0ABW1ZA95_9BACT|nr:Ig-like domain repeat protein [Granulicella cerasi]